MRTLNYSWRCLILACLLVSACGGEGGSSPSQTQTQTMGLPHVKSPVAECLAHQAHSHGIEGTGLRGVVTAVTDSTVTVSTIVFDASDADVFVNGVCATLGEVHPGATATVYGDFSDTTHTGTATAIYVEEAVVGSIDAIDGSAGTMSIIGQSIAITPATALGDDIQPNQLSTLSVGDMVAVSGVMHQDGKLEATRIRRWPQAAFFAVAGVVTTIDSAHKFLRVGGVTVRYADAQLVNFADAAIHSGDYVRALGQNSVLTGSTSGIDASAIERAVIPAPDPSKDIVLNGAINFVRADDDFDVMGQPVKITSNTRGTAGFQPETNWKAYGPPGFITIFGSLDPSGYVIADMVVPQGGGDAGLTGPITAIDRAAHTLEIMGVAVQLSSYCYLAGSDGQAVNFDALNVGDELSVAGDELSGAGSGAGTSWIDCLTADHSGPSNAASVRGGGPMRSQRPILIVDFGIRADTTNAKFHYGHTLGGGCSCIPSSADAFWSLGGMRAMDTTSHVVGTWTGDHIDASDVYFMEE